MARFDSPLKFFGSRRYLTTLAAAATIGTAATVVRADYQMQSTPISMNPITLVQNYPSNMISSTITLPTAMTGTIVDMWVQVKMYDTSVGDLTIKLVGPSNVGTGMNTAMLLNRPGIANPSAQQADNGADPSDGFEAYLGDGTHGSPTYPIKFQDPSPSGNTNLATDPSSLLGAGLQSHSYVGDPNALSDYGYASPNIYAPDPAGDTNPAVGTLSAFYGETVPANTQWTLDVGISGTSMGTLDSWTLWVATTGTPSPEPATGAIGAAGAIAFLMGRRGRTRTV
jgi:subtilisin-like proprotein convertase family protein